MQTTVSRDSIALGAANFRAWMSQVVQEAGDEAVAQGRSLSDYDPDGDGNLEDLIVVFAGSDEQGSLDAGDPGTGQLLTTGVSFAGGWTAETAIFVGETSKGMLFSAGTVGHEIGHSLGLSDLYDTDASAGGASNGMGTWDAMSWGESGIVSIVDGDSTWYATGFRAYSRYLLGWISPSRAKWWNPGWTRSFITPRAYPRACSTCAPISSSWSIPPRRRRSPRGPLHSGRSRCGWSPVACAWKTLRPERS